jgi:hypothetical protein
MQRFEMTRVTSLVFYGEITRHFPITSLIRSTRVKGVIKLASVTFKPVRKTATARTQQFEAIFDRLGKNLTKYPQQKAKEQMVLGVATPDWRPTGVDRKTPGMQQR